MRLRERVRERPVAVALAVCWAAATLVASLVAPPQGGAGLAAVGPLGLLTVDRWVHALTYATLTLLVARALGATTDRGLFVAALASVGFGLVVEALQYPIPSRACDPADALTNAVGAAVAVVVLAAVRRVRGRSRE
ncbi:MAG: VanZ family protein [Haloferacaceae archaeon]